MEVTVMDMLQARDRRAARQQALLSQFGGTLVCFTMNIAGPVKRSPLIEGGFDLGRRLLEQQLLAAGAQVRHREEIRVDTGCEALYALDLPALEAKALAAEIEDHTTAGRLFDLDVLRPDGTKVERQELGLERRRCLICGGPAQACARSRAHTVAQLRETTDALLTAALREDGCKTAARLACQALLYEVAVTPKPGLVDRANSGSHRDMDFFTFQAAAAALWPYFARCAEIGMDTGRLEPPRTFAALRTAGKLAEGEMLRATGGVNTHKGAIFSMGILCGALGRLDRVLWRDPERVLRECAAMTRGLVSGDYAGLTPETAKTAGQRLYLQYGVTGVRGQAEAGFPTGLQVGLPRLEEGLALGKSVNEAGCAALLAMLAAAEDTNLIHRGGAAVQRRVTRALSDWLRENPFPGERELQAMDRAFIERNLSPGGTADLLAMTFVLHFLKEEP